MCTGDKKASMAFVFRNKGDTPYILTRITRSTAQNKYKIHKITYLRVRFSLLGAFIDTLGVRKEV